MVQVREVIRSSKKMVASMIKQQKDSGAGRASEADEPWVQMLRPEMAKDAQLNKPHQRDADNWACRLLQILLTAKG